MLTHVGIWAPLFVVGTYLERDVDQDENLRQGDTGFNCRNAFSWTCCPVWNDHGSSRHNDDFDLDAARRPFD